MSDDQKEEFKTLWVESTARIVNQGFIGEVIGASKKTVTIVGKVPAQLKPGDQVYVAVPKRR